MGKRGLELSEEQILELKSGYAEGKKQVFRKRCQIILLKNQKRTALEVARTLEMHHHSVGFWIKRYKQGGIKALHAKPGRGRKPILDIGREAEIVKEAVFKEPQRLKPVKSFLEKKLDKNLSAKTLSRFLKKIQRNLEKNPTQAQRQSRRGDLRVKKAGIVGFERIGRPGGNRSVLR